ncbi:VOC family protein [Gordonia sp. HY002]|uniref:VOC family protein n=1 Tax=Gordonia zhenghanii TaxID=2911516 RepID=UPI001EF0C768|nr:VOC family protein [Gordonia zhenghanii]MCF8570919.1 VOC family protein [Gordonia zhenghanii]MCF8607904.1 VOC family protein [Gordonia zhenghanii]
MKARIELTSIFVDDQAKALDFYTNRLGFVVKDDVPTGEYRWLTVVSGDSHGGPELLLEPNAHPAAQAYQEALVADGIPCASFAVDDVHAACTELAADSVRIATQPMEAGPVVVAVVDDTCGNLIQLMSRQP